MLVAAIDWTYVIVALIAGLPAIISAVLGAHIVQQIKTPSGEPIGRVSEKSHDMTSANFALLRKVADKNGVEKENE